MSKNIGFGLKFLLLIGLTVVIYGTVAAQPAKLADAKSVQKLERLFKGSGYKYEKKKGENIWVIEQEGNIFFFSFVEDMFFGANVLADKARFRTSVESLTELLRMNDTFDQVKIGIDEDGGVTMRAEARIRLLDKKEFKEMVKQLFNASNEAITKLQPVLVK